MSTEHDDVAGTPISRREFLRLAGLSSGAILLAACGGTPPTTPVAETGATATAAAAPEAPAEAATTEATVEVPTPTPPPVGTGSTQITWFNSYSTASTQEVIPEILEAFVKQHPEVSVQRVGPEAGGNLQEALLARIAAGNPPDTSVIYSTPAELAARGALMALDEMMATAKTAKKDAFFEAPLKSCQWQGKTYGLPASAGAGAIFLNVKMFKDKGISTKREDFPKTWDDVKALSKEFVVKNADKIETAGLVPWTASWLNPVWSALNGGQIFDAQAGKYTLDSENNVQWLQYWVQWLDEQYGGDIEKFNTSGQWGDTYAGNAFQANQQAMALGGSWETTDSDIPFDWEVVKLPYGPQGQKSVTGFWPNWFVVPTGSKHPNEGFQFIEYFATEGWEIWYRLITDTPAWKAFPPEVLTTKMVGKIGQERARDVHQFFADYLNDATEMWNSPVESFASDTINAAIDEVLHKQKKPQDALKEAQTICQAKLEEVVRT